MEPNVIVDMAEDEVDEAVVQLGVKNDDGHGAGEEIVGAVDENVVDQISHTSIHTYNPTINWSIWRNTFNYGCDLVKLEFAFQIQNRLVVRLFY